MSKSHAEAGDSTAETEDLAGSDASTLTDGGTAGEHDTADGYYSISPAGNSDFVGFKSVATISDKTTDSDSGPLAGLLSGATASFHDHDLGALSDTITLLGSTQASGTSTSMSTTLIETESDQASSDDSEIGVDAAGQATVDTSDTDDSDYDKLSITSITPWDGITTTSGSESTQENGTAKGKLDDTWNDSKDTDDSSGKASVGGLQLVTFSDTQFWDGLGLHDVFKENGTDDTTDTSSDNTSDTSADDVVGASGDTDSTEGDDLWGNSTDTANGIFTLNSLGLTASGGYTQIDNNGFDNDDSGNGPFAGLVGLTGTDTKTQSIDDTESDTGGGTYSLSGGILTTMGNYTETDTDTDDASFTGLSGKHGTGTSDIYDKHDGDTDNSTITESGHVTVVAGVTTSASGTYSETDSSNVTDGTTDDSADDTSTGGRTDNLSNDDTIHATSNDGFGESASFNQTPDGFGGTLISTSLSFGGSIGGSYSNLDKKTDEYSEDDAEKDDQGGSTDTDSTTDTSDYSQRGTDNSVNDDGLVGDTPDITTTQNGSFTNKVVGKATDSEPKAFLGPTTVSGNATDPLTVFTYSAKDHQDTSGHSGSLTETNDTSTTGSDTDANVVVSGTTTSNSDNKTTTQINYGPSGGTQTIQHSTSSDSDGNQHFFPPPNDPGEGPTDVPTGSGPEESSTTVKSDVGSQDGSKPDRAAPVAAGPQAMPAGVKGKPSGNGNPGEREPGAAGPDESAVDALIARHSLHGPVSQDFAPGSAGDKMEGIDKPAPVPLMRVGVNADLSEPSTFNLMLDGALFILGGPSLPSIAGRAGGTAAAAKGLAEVAGGFCFRAGTLVAAEDRQKPIESVATGERVWSYNLTSAEWQLCRVSETYVFEHVGEMIEISVAGQKIESTYHHPYWVVEGRNLDLRPKPDHVVSAEVKNALIPGRWVDAGNLWVGDVVLLMDGRRVPIDDIVVHQLEGYVYNFAVKGLHNYAVGPDRVLVHNNCGAALGGGAAKLTPAQAEITASLVRLQGMRALQAEMASMYAAALSKGLPTAAGMALESLRKFTTRIALEEAFFDFLSGGL